MRKQLSIKLKITLFYTVCTTFIVAVMMLFMIHISSVVVDGDVKDKLVLMVEQDAENIDFDIIDEDEIGEAHADGNIVMQLDDGYIGCLCVNDTYISTKNGVKMFIFSSSGKIIRGMNSDYDFTDIEIVTDEISRVDFYETPHYMYAKKISLTDKKITVDFLLVGVTQDTKSVFHGTTGHLVMVSFIILPVAIFLAGLLGYIITKGLFKPFTAITDTARSISSTGDLSRRIELSPGTDELHVLADTYNMMFQRLQTSFESEKDFISDSSHELRTPTAIIRAQCEYALSEPRSDEEYVESLEVINRQSNRMNLVISQLLSFTRLEQGTQKLELEKIDLGEFVGELCMDMEAIGRSDITLTYETKPGLYINADITLLSRMITNLISNAYKYGKEGGFIKVRVDTDNKENAGFALIKVEDNGIGIAKEDLDKIFRRFYRGDKSRAQDPQGDTSTGLGLAFVEKIANLHGGSVSARSRQGEGSLFTVKIPIV